MASCFSKAEEWELIENNPLLKLKPYKVDVLALVSYLSDSEEKSWKGLLKDAGIENFRWHDMRHHFSSKLVIAGISKYRKGIARTQ